MTDKRWYEFSPWDVVVLAALGVGWVWLLGPPDSIWAWLAFPVGLLIGRATFRLAEIAAARLRR